MKRVVTYLLPLLILRAVRLPGINNDGNNYFTQNNKSQKRYAIVYLKEGDVLPASVIWKTNVPKKGSKVTMLETGERVKWTWENDAVKVFIPSAMHKSKEALPALTFSYTPAE